MREWKGFGEGMTVKVGGEVVYIQKKEERSQNTSLWDTTH